MVKRVDLPAAPALQPSRVSSAAASPPRASFQNALEDKKAPSETGGGAAAAEVPFGRQVIEKFVGKMLMQNAFTPNLTLKKAEIEPY